MKKFTLLIALLLFAVTGTYAQASIYTFAQSNETYVPITGGTVITSSTDGSPDLDSYASTEQTLPVAFEFSGTTYNSFYVSSNGHLSLGTTSTSAYTTTPISNSIAGNVIMSPLAADLEEGANGVADIRFEMVGDEIVIQWANFRRYSRTESFNFQVRLNSVSGAVKFVYDGTPPYDTATDAQPQVGIKSAIGEYMALTVADGGSWDTPVVITTGVTGASKASLKGDDGFTSGLTYTWTQPLPCTGTPIAGTVTGDLMRYICSGNTPSVINVTGATAAIPGIVYQWEQSLNGTDWADVTDGSGATTASYTPAAFDGTPKQYRLRITCTNSSETVYTSAVTIDNQEAPINQTTNVTFDPENTFSTSFVMNWTSGNGDRRMVVISDVAIVDPVDEAGVAAITANNVYAGTGQQIIYDGLSTSATVYGLACNTSYFVKVYDYNRCGTTDSYSVYYNVTEDTNVATVTTNDVTTAALPVLNSFTGFTGADLITAVPGWYEANVPTVSGDMPLNSYPGSITSTWRNSSVFGVTTAAVNLYYDDRNEWIISPKMEITADSRLVFDAAITDYASLTEHSDGMQGTDDAVNVLVSIDGCGAEWTSIYTFNAANTTELTNELTEYRFLLTDYIGQTIQVAFQGTDGTINDLPDYDFHIGNIVIEEVPACEVPTLMATVDVTKNSATIVWEAPELSTPTGYEYVVSNISTTPVSAGTSTTDLTANITSLMPSTEYFVFVRTDCGGEFSEWTVAGAFMTLCEYPEIDTVTPSSVCGQGEVSLSATSTGGLYWYNSLEGGSVLVNADTYTTPLLTETTSFYVASANAVPGVDVPVGAGSSTSSTYSNPFYSAWSNTHTQHLITAEELSNAGLSAGEINSIALDVTSAGLLPMIDLSVKIGTTTAVSMEDFATDALSIVYNNASYMPTVGINTLTFDTPFMWDGTSSVLVEFCHGNENSSNTMYRTVRSDLTDYVSSVKRHISAATSATDVCGATTGGTLASYSVRPQFYFNGVGLCFSPRQEVIATVTDAPEITVNDAVAICAGEDTEISVISDNTDYTYNWMPGNLDGAVQTVAPSETTTYTVTATDAVSGCVTTGTVTVTVNALPVGVSIDPATVAVCEGAIEALTVNGAISSGDAVIGTGTTAPSTTSYPNPFSAYYGGAKTQILYKTDELEAQGLIAGTSINSLSFDFFASVANTCNDLTIRIGTTTDEELTSGFTSSTGFTTVYNANFTPVAGTTGLVPFNFTTPFVWNGENIIVEVLHNQGNWGNGSGTRTNTTTTTFNSVYYGAVDSETPAVAASLDALDEEDFGIDGTSTLRPNVVFNYELTNTVVWSPIEGLYADADATIAYNGEDVATVYVMPTAATTYTATVTNDAGCSVSATVDVSVSIVDAPTVDNADVAICNAGTVADLMATGDNIQWYADATGGTALADETALADGTYYASQTVDGCESATRTAVTVTVNVVAAPTGETSQTITADIATDVTIEDIEVTAEDGVLVTWYASEADALAGENALIAGTMLTDGTTYYATQTIDGCESNTVLTVTVGVVLGRDDFNINTFSYYPNPVKDILNLSYDKEITSVAVFNLLGQQVMANTPNATEVRLDMSILSDGTYLVSVTAGNIVKTIKVVKKQ